MTSKLTRQTTDAGKLEKFPVFPPRDDMQNSLHLDRPAHQAALYRHFGGSDTVIVLSEIPVRWSPPQQEGHRIPDLLIAFNVDFPLGVDQRGYSIRDQGKPPDFVLEIASPTTGREDYTGKRSDYAAFGIPEYWRFDPSGGRYHGDPMGGDRLVGDAYQPVELLELGPDHLHGHSEVLNLDLCWENGRLRWWDPATQRYLLTFDEIDDARANAEARADSALTRANSAEARADSAEARADRERDARTEAEARIRELEAELERRGGV